MRGKLISVGNYLVSNRLLMNCFMEFIDRLQNAVGRIFRDPQAGVPFVTQLVYENAIVVFHSAIQSKNRLIFIFGQKSDTHTSRSGYGCSLVGFYSKSKAFPAQR